MESNVEELAAVVLGNRRTDLEGGGRSEDGVVQSLKKIDAKVDAVSDKVDGLARKFDNGGIRVRLTPGQWATVTALIGLISALVGAFFNTPTPTP